MRPILTLDVARIRWHLARLSRRVSLQEPWTADPSLDALSLEEWLRSIRASATARGLMAIASRVTWGCEPDKVSMLHAVRYLKAAGGMDRRRASAGPAQIVADARPRYVDRGVPPAVA